MTAQDYANKTTISWDEFLRWVHSKPGYDWTKAWWYKAGAELQAGKTQPPPPLPPPPVVPPPANLAALAQNVMFTAWNPNAALRGFANRNLANWKIAVSADPAYDQAARAAAPLVKQTGHKLAVWGVQTQIGADRIKKFGSDVGADYLIFQAESGEEFSTALAAGAQVIVGNPNSWTQAQRDQATGLINQGLLAVAFEVYTNEGSPWPDAASAQGVPCASEVLGVGWGATPYHLVDYQSHSPMGVWASMGVYLAEAMNDNDWGLLAQG